jgi:hypothetical protein
MEAPPAGLVHAGIVGVISQRPSVAKDGTNAKQGYKFRRIDDFYAVMQPLMAFHSLHILPHRVVEDSLYERQTKDGGTIIHVRTRVEFRVYHAQDGSYVSVETVGEGMDYGGDKASNKAMSAAMKYALTQLFLVQTGEHDDSEVDSPEAAGTPRAPRPSRPQRPPPSEPRRPPPPEIAALPAAQPAAAAADDGADMEMVPVYAKAPGSKVWAEAGHAPRLDRRQQARIKILQAELKIDVGPWRDKLFETFGKTSSSLLSSTEADEWATKLELSKRARAQRAPATT